MTFSCFRRFCLLCLNKRTVPLFTKKFIQNSTSVRYLCVDNGRSGVSQEISETKNSFDDKFTKQAANGEKSSGTVIQEQEYHNVCNLLKNKDFDGIPVLIFILPRLAIRTGMHKNFVEEIVSDWYLAFEKHLPNVLPYQLYDCFSSLIHIEKETNGDLLKNLTFANALKIFDITLRTFIRDERRLYNLIKQLVRLINASSENAEPFIRDLKEKMLIAFESYVEASSTSEPHHLPVANRLDAIMHKVAIVGISKPSDVCLHRVSRLIVKQLYVSSIKSSTFVSITKLETMTLGLLHAIAIWNFDPERYYKGFWSIYFATVCNYHYLFSDFVTRRLLGYTYKFNVNFNMNIFNCSPVKIGGISCEEQVRRVLKNSDQLFYDSFATPERTVLKESLFKSKHSRIPEDVNQLCKDLIINPGLPLGSLFFEIPSVFHDLHMDQYFIDNIALNWLSILKKQYDPSWAAIMIEKLQVLQNINRATNNAFLQESKFLEFVSSMLEIPRCLNPFNKPEIIVKFLHRHLHLFGSNSQEKIAVESNLRRFWETFFMNFNDNDLPPFLTVLNNLNEFCKTRFTGVEKPSEPCLRQMINVVNNLDFSLDENKSILSLTFLAEFSNLLTALNINTDLYVDGYSENYYTTISAIYKHVSAQLSSQWMLAALQFDCVKEFMEFKPYWSKILDTKLLSQSNVDKLIEAKKGWSLKHTLN